MGALALTGRDAEAREALRRYLALPSVGPLKTIAAWRAYTEADHGDPRFVEARERMNDGLLRRVVAGDAIFGDVSAGADAVGPVGREWSAVRAESRAGSGGGGRAGSTVLSGFCTA